LAEKFFGKYPLGEPRRRWEDDVKINLGKTGYEVDETGSKLLLY
jgi:hypothetical protein